MTSSKPTPFDAISFRQTLHQAPELSGLERNTASLIAKQLMQFGLEPITGVGGHGILCVIEGQEEGQITLLRADFDAVSVQEKACHNYVSGNPGVMHACGHDGHATSLLMVAKALSEQAPQKGKIILLFQPAEELGTGAAAMLSHPALSDFEVDNAFAFHNLPGYPLHQIVIRPDTFACASTGVEINLHGKTSHAARPEDGLSPMSAMIEVMQFLQSLPSQYPDSFTLVTVVHARLGEAAFGVSPGEAQVMATLRSDSNVSFSSMKSKLKLRLVEIENKTGIAVTFNWQEPFNAAINSPSHTELIRQQAVELGFSVYDSQEPMRWSEDFAEFLLRWKGALFCIGSGETHPQLHNSDYDFPDEILDTASSLFLSIVSRLHS